VKHLAARRGFTVLEILVAITVLGIFLLPLMSLLSRGLRSEAALSDVQTALKIAQDAMERLLDTQVKKAEIRDEGTTVTVGGITFRVERDAIDGRESDEPALGTDPLEIWIRVYKGEETAPIAELVTLKEDW
jgi:prepilin-type N-terminal cleavage/methylation domain-containing protein